MREIHAYQNKDGTYRLECIADTYIDGELMEAKIIYERAKLTIDALTGSSSNTICEIIYEENENETNRCGQIIRRY